jgi:hypothetical protein
MPLFASGAFGQLRYITESTIGVTPGSGNGVNLRQTGPTMKAAVATTSSAEVRQDRLVTGLTRTDLNIDGGFNFEFSAKEYDPFIEGLIGSAYTHFGVAGIGAAIPTSCTTTATTITAGAATSGASIFTALAAGSWFKLVPPVGASQAIKDYFADAWLKALSTTSTAITLDTSTPIAAVGQGSIGVGTFVTQSLASNGASLTRGFTLEYALTDIAKFLPFQGMRANTFELDVQVGSIITGSFGFVGQNHGVAGVGMLAATTLPGSPVASQSLDVMNAVADVGMLMENGVNLLTGGSFIKSVKLMISNNMRGQKAVGVFGNAGVGLGSLEITGTLELYIADAVYYNRWFAGTNTSLAFGFADSAGNGYLIELDKVSFKDGSMNPGGQSDDSMLTLPFQAFYNATTNRGIRITRGIVA